MLSGLQNVKLHLILPKISLQLQIDVSTSRPSVVLIQVDDDGIGLVHWQLEYHRSSLTISIYPYGT